MGKNVKGSYVDGAYVTPQENIEIKRIVPKRPAINEQKNPKNK